MSKYRKKPIVIEAFELGSQQAPQWFVDAVLSGIAYKDPARPEAAVFIQTLEGEMRGDHGDYIIQGIKGELYPCKADIFAATYEAAE